MERNSKWMPFNSIIDGNEVKEKLSVVELK